MNNLLALTIGDQEIDVPGSVPQGGLFSGENTTGQTIIQNSIQILLVFAVVLSLFFIIWAGLKWMTSNGDKAKIESARKTIIYSILGLIIAFLSFFIISVIGYFFGVELIRTQPFAQPPPGNAF